MHWVWYWAILDREIVVGVRSMTSNGSASVPPLWARSQLQLSNPSSSPAWQTAMALNRTRPKGEASP